MGAGAGGGGRRRMSKSRRTGGREEADDGGQEQEQEEQEQEQEQDEEEPKGGTNLQSLAVPGLRGCVVLLIFLEQLGDADLRRPVSAFRGKSGHFL